VNAARNGGYGLRREVVTVCRRLYERGLIAGGDGNVSVRLSPSSILVTPAGVSKVDVRPEDLIELRMDGTKLRGTGRASTEVAMHLRIYERRPDVGAVVHAHPPTATGFAVAGEGFGECVLPELVFQVGWVPLVPYGTPGTADLADRFEPYVMQHDAFLMANHGATTCGATLLVAHQRMDSLEHAARILFTARSLGRVNALPRRDVDALVSMRERAAPGAVFPGCPAPPGGRRME
jgi:L-fuculose-phosphate aldolase